MGFRGLFGCVAGRRENRMETISGYVNKIVFRNEETGYAVVELFGGGS